MTPILWLVIAGVAAAAGLGWWLASGRQRAAQAETRAESGPLTHEEAIHHLLLIAEPGSLPLTRSFSSFHIGGEYTKDLRSLSPAEIGGAVEMLGTLAESDVRGGDWESARRKLLDASALAYGGRGPIGDRGWEKLALASYNLGAVEAAFLMMKEMDEPLIVTMQVEPALAGQLGDIQEGASLDGWLNAAIAWRRTTLHGAAADQYQAAVAALR